MNRKDFLSQLEQLLSDIPEMERREAMEYYENYFEDAGPYKEAQIINELGTPQKVAESIKRDLFGESYQEYERANQEKQQEALKRQQKENKTLRNILIVVVLVLTFPVWIGLLAGAFGIVVGALATVFGLAVAAVAIVGSFLLAGIVLVVGGIVKAFTGFSAVGFIMIAIGMLLFAVGILGLVALVWMIGKILPWGIRAIVRLCKRPFQKRGASI